MTHLSHRLACLIADAMGLPRMPESQQLVDRRIQAYAAANGEASVKELVESKNVEALRNIVAVQWSWFWRDARHLSALAEQMLPKLRSGAPVRVWSAATANGEEAYSIAMALLEAAAHHARSTAACPIQVVGTDINAVSIVKASQGCYSEKSVNQVPAELRKKYLALNADSTEWEVQPALREVVAFATLDLMNIPHEVAGTAQRFDAIFCRNVLMYFLPPYRYAVLEALAARLNPNGLLFLSPAESIGAAAHLYRNYGQGIFGLNPRPATRATKKRRQPITADQRPSRSGERTLTKA